MDNRNRKSLRRNEGTGLTRTGRDDTSIHECGKKARLSRPITAAPQAVRREQTIHLFFLYTSSYHSNPRDWPLSRRCATLVPKKLGSECYREKS